MAARSPQKVKGTEIERIAAAEDECQNLYQLAMQLIRQRRELRLGAVDLRSPTRIVKNSTRIGGGLSRRLLPIGFES